jgi:hypothetical protein
MPEVSRSAHFHDRSAEFRRLAKERDEAGHRESSAMLRQVAAEFEAEASELDGTSSV